MKLETKIGSTIIRTITLPHPHKCEEHICKGATHQTVIIGGVGGVWRHHSEQDARGGHETAVRLVEVVG